MSLDGMAGALFLAAENWRKKRFWCPTVPPSSIDLSLFATKQVDFLFASVVVFNTMLLEGNPALSPGATPRDALSRGDMSQDKAPKLLLHAGGGALEERAGSRAVSPPIQIQKSPFKWDEPPAEKEPKSSVSATSTRCLKAYKMPLNCVPRSRFSARENNYADPDPFRGSSSMLKSLNVIGFRSASYKDTLSPCYSSSHSRPVPESARMTGKIRYSSLMRASETFNKHEKKSRNTDTPDLKLDTNRGEEIFWLEGEFRRSSLENPFNFDSLNRHGDARLFYSTERSDESASFRRRKSSTIERETWGKYSSADPDAIVYPSCAKNEGS